VDGCISNDRHNGLFIIQPLEGKPQEVMTRGIRNNNPGNIRISPAKWKGKIPVYQNTDGSFAQFTSMAYGIRALYRLLITYINKYGLTTVDAIIDRYAPAGDNSEAARTNYKNFVRQQINGKNEIENIFDFLALANGIMIFENSQTDFDQYIMPHLVEAQEIADLEVLNFSIEKKK
jgi:hypothetical protein